MKSLIKSKIKLQFTYESAFSTNTDDLHKLLDESSYVSKKPSKEKKEQVEKKSTYKEFEPSSLQEIYDLIKQMRVSKNAPVDEFGPQNIYDVDAKLDDQRFQILVSLMLSPQTKDEITGMCMLRLLKHPCTIDSIADVPVDEFKKLIFESNFNATKAKRIIAMAKIVRDEMDGKMPLTYEQVMKFGGVGEKIALLYMLIAMNEALGIAVDVNIMRVCNRIPIYRANSPARLRKELEKIVPKDQWETFNHDVVGFGQQICRVGGRELCGQCLLYKNNLCEYGYKKMNGELQVRTKSVSKNVSKSVSKSVSTKISVSKIVSKTKSVSGEEESGE